jgi:hypothetical protein
MIYQSGFVLGFQVTQLCRYFEQPASRHLMGEVFLGATKRNCKIFGTFSMHTISQQYFLVSVLILAIQTVYSEYMDSNDLSFVSSPYPQFFGVAEYCS